MGGAAAGELAVELRCPAAGTTRARCAPTGVDAAQPAIYLSDSAVVLWFWTAAVGAPVAPCPPSPLPRCPLSIARNALSTNPVCSSSLPALPRRVPSLCLARRDGPAGRLPRQKRRADGAADRTAQVGRRSVMARGVLGPASLTSTARRTRRRPDAIVDFDGPRCSGGPWWRCASHRPSGRPPSMRRGAGARTPARGGPSAPRHPRVRARPPGPARGG